MKKFLLLAACLVSLCSNAFADTYTDENGLE